MKITKEKLDEIKASKPIHEKWIRVGLSSCGIAAGAKEVFEVMKSEIEKRNLDISIKQCGCIGMCYAEPLVEVKIPGMPHVFYGKVNEETAVAILNEHVGKGMLLDDHLYDVAINQ